MSNQIIKLDTIGQIIEGDSKGWYIYIKEDLEKSGGYFLLLSPKPVSDKHNTYSGP